MAKRKMNEQLAKMEKIEEENAEMKSKIIKLQEEKVKLHEEKAELSDKLLDKNEKMLEAADKLSEKKEECNDLKLKMKEMEAKIEKLEETVKGFNEKPITSLGGKQRKNSEGREAFYAMMEGWSFQGEIEKMNYYVLRWIDEIVMQPRLKDMFRWVPITPQRFMKYLADGFMLGALARILGENQIDAIPRDKKKCYQYFYKFAKEEAKLAEGCIFLEEELFGETYDDYKSVFYTLYKLAEQAREKFNEKTLWDIADEEGDYYYNLEYGI